MKIARVTGTVNATAKDLQLTGLVMMLTDVLDGEGAVLEKSVVAVDTCSAGPGDKVLLVTGSAARTVSKISGAPVDAAIVAIIDKVDITV
ncbi:EutN/CcmL family microcompartment protein [Alphaproteobacteria bacterium]|jgi:ethanolamine utilization protein EutN|nr:EutN/CcmL family microcompartment protein [Alphaproteobacteria bacterium]